MTQDHTSGGGAPPKRVFIVDTETTGLYALGDKQTPRNYGEPDQLVEIAVVEIVDGQLTGRHFSTLVHPGKSIPSEASGIHGITDEMVRDAPRFDSPELKRVIMDFIGPLEEALLVSHNARFDQGFLPWLRDDPSTRWICSLKLSRKIWPTAPKHKNDILAEYLNLTVDFASDLPSHRALRDAYVSGTIYLEALRKEREISPVETPLDRLLPVGFKDFKGRKLRDIPPSYARAVCKRIDGFDPELLAGLELRASQPQETPLTLGKGRYANTPLELLPEDYARWALQNTFPRLDIRDALEERLGLTEPAARPVAQTPRRNPFLGPARETVSSGVDKLVGILERGTGGRGHR